MVPRPEYPRPQFRRATWFNLNGEWGFAFDDDDIGLAQGWQRVSAAQFGPGRAPFTELITVPFCFQAPLSGIGDTAFHDVVWYARVFNTPPLDRAHQSLLLHFGAVDYRATVWVNGAHVAEHEGGHTPICADITYALGTEQNVVVVRVHDPSRDMTIPRGKQYWKEESEDIFYTRTTGIWQTVWLEPVNRTRIGSLRLTPDVDTGCVHVETTICGFAEGLGLRLTVTRDQDLVIDNRVGLASASVARHLPLTRSDDRQSADLWSPEQPNLHDLRLDLTDAKGTLIDTVESYFGMRKIEAREGKVYLNGRPYYQRLVLDQGYFPRGVLTAPTDDDLRRDIELAKQMGFNGARKHQKVEDPRWLYWADRLGFLVWGEMPNAFQFSFDYVRRITAEWQEVVRRDYNHPCVVVWVPMNESFGGRRVAGEPLQVEHLLAMYHLTRSLDDTRLVVPNDGWEIVGSDLCTIHDYSDVAALARRYRTLELSIASDPAKPPVYYPGHSYRGEPILITEFGGIALRADSDRGWGFNVVVDSEELLSRYEEMVTALLESEIIQGFCYTQLTDVEQEVDGLLTYDREPKADPASIRAITAREKSLEPSTSRSAGSPGC